MPRTLLKNGYVVTVDEDRAVYPGGFVAVEDATISAIGPTSAALSEREFDEVIDVSGCIVLPGLINCHQHHWYTLFKGLADGYLLEDWVSGFLLPLTLQLSRPQPAPRPMPRRSRSFAISTESSFVVPSSSIAVVNEAVPSLRPVSLA